MYGLQKMMTMAILKKSCTKFEIAYEQAKNEGYIFITKKHLCQISSVEDLVFDDVLMMIPEMEDVGVSNLLDEFQGLSLTNHTSPNRRAKVTVGSKETTRMKVQMLKMKVRKKRKKKNMSHKRKKK